MAKMDKAQKEERGGRTSTKPTMHSYVHSQERISMKFSFQKTVVYREKQVTVMMKLIINITVRTETP